jgi:hypothetical protein
MLPRLGAIARVLVLPVLLFALVGCGPEPDPWPSGTSTPTPEATPLWADDDEALEMAVAAYQEYLDVWFELAADPSQDPEPLRELVTKDRMTDERYFFEELASSGARFDGTTKITYPQLQRVDENEVVYSACWDRTGARQVLRDGSVDEGHNSGTIVTMLVEGGALKFSAADPWDGPPTCA